MNKKGVIVWIGFLLVWIVVHIPAITYGTQNTPLHQSYIGDEQSPVNGALHMLQDKSLWGFRNLPTVYYGPVFSVVALPAVIADVAAKLATHTIHNLGDYKNYVIWNWGGIIWKARLISAIAGFLALWTLYALLMTVTVNPTRNRRLAVIGVSLLALNFYFFEYSSFFKHWIYFIAGMSAQMYLLVRMLEDREHVKKYYVWQGVIFVLSFGVSYLPALSQIIFLPVLIKWIKEKDWQMLKAFGWYVIFLIVPILLVIYWHPRAFLRVINLAGGDVSGTGFNGWTTEARTPGFSFAYYGSIILNNHLSLLVAWITLVILAIRKHLHRKYMFWIPLCGLLLFYTIFGLMGHHEARYVLPTVVSLIVSTAMLLVTLWPTFKARTRIIVAVLLIAYLAYHIISLFFWEQSMKAGPTERQAINDSITYEQAHPGSKELYISYYLVGYPHTKDAYTDYANRYGRADSNLFQAILSTPYPAGIAPLNIYYLHPDQLKATSTSFKSYDRVVYHYQPLYEQHLDPDALEINLIRYWTNYKVWTDSFFVMKQK